MFPHTKQANEIAVLAAAIIRVRNVSDPKSLREAWQDAYWTLEKGVAADPVYKEYQLRHGEKPTTEVEDNAEREKRAKNMEANIKRMPGSSPGWMGA